MQIKRSLASGLLFLIGLYIIIVVLYINGRYAGSWLNDDAIAVTRLSQYVYNEGTLTPRQGAYSYGYAYQSLNSFLAYLSGTSVVVWQEFWQPFLIVILVPISFIAFRSLVDASHTALLAVILLFLQPEFLFEAMRSSHAKITWSLALLMLFLLARSLRDAEQPKGFGAGVLAFYLAAFALITSNSFFASNYIFGIVFAFVGIQILGRLPWSRAILIPPQMRRLWLVALSCLILAFTFIFYLYSPALQQFVELESIVDKVAALFLDVEQTTATNPYGYVEATWLSPSVYLAVSAANWIVLVLSFAAWLYWGWQYLIRRQPILPTMLLLWLLYTASAFLLAMAVVLDVAGALSANMQVRLFPHFMVVGIPLAAMIITMSVQRSQTWPSKARAVILISLPVFLALLAAAGLFKVTNEPLLSNWWAFYLPGERQVVVWNGTHLQSNSVWVGDDRRLTILVDAYGDWRAQQIHAERGERPVASRYVILSPIVEARAMRLQYALPDVHTHQWIYDNGQAQLFYSRPQTPFQR